MIIFDHISMLQLFHGENAFLGFWDFDQLPDELGRLARVVPHCLGPSPEKPQGKDFTRQGFGDFFNNWPFYICVTYFHFNNLV